MGTTKTMRQTHQRKKARYPLKNWAAYDRALQQRGSLTVWGRDEAMPAWEYHGPRKRGGQMVYSALTIETALTVRAVYHLPLRQTEGDWKGRQHGVSNRRTWRRLHFAVDAATGDSVAETVTDNRVDDGDQMSPKWSRSNHHSGPLGAMGPMISAQSMRRCRRAPTSSRPRLT